jgi:hypothetical protein
MLLGDGSLHKEAQPAMQVLLQDFAHDCMQRGGGSAARSAEVVCHAESVTRITGQEWPTEPMHLIAWTSQNFAHDFETPPDRGADV